MSSDLRVTSNNGATLNLPPNAAGILTVKTNSAALQFVDVQVVGGPRYSFAGMGELNTPIGSMVIQPMPSAQRVQFTLEYATEGQTGARAPTRVQTGGPYAIGNFNTALVVGEDGNDNDFNDVICQVNWRTPN